MIDMQLVYFFLVKWVVENIAYDQCRIGLKIRKQWEPYPNLTVVVLQRYFVIGQAVVVGEQTRAYVECDKDIDWVVFVAGEQKE